MVAHGHGALIVTGNTSALRGKPTFAGFAPTKAAQRILAQAIAREVGPRGVHVAYVVIDAVIDVPWTRQAFAAGRDDFASPGHEDEVPRQRQFPPGRSTSDHEAARRALVKRATV
jgi:NAD(P)-dependent dehydrogenase (short-subunit alcohol dehydrogenase family)